MLLGLSTPSLLYNSVLILLRLLQPASVCIIMWFEEMRQVKRVWLFAYRLVAYFYFMSTPL